MSRYVIWIDDDNLEVFTGFDEGLRTFFLTIADSRICTGESGSYLFHNLDHHPGPGMRLDEVVATLEQFGIKPPDDLLLALRAEAYRFDVEPITVADSERTSFRKAFSTVSKQHRVLGW